MKKAVSLPVEIAVSTARTLASVGRQKRVTPRLRREALRAAAELEVRVGLTQRGEVEVPKSLVLKTLRCFTQTVPWVAYLWERLHVAGMKDK